MPRILFWRESNASARKTMEEPKRGRRKACENIPATCEIAPFSASPSSHLGGSMRRGASFSNWRKATNRRPMSRRTRRFSERHRLGRFVDGGCEPPGRGGSILAAGDACNSLGGRNQGD